MIDARTLWTVAAPAAQSGPRASSPLGWVFAPGSRFTLGSDPPSLSGEVDNHLVRYLAPL